MIPWYNLIFLITCCVSLGKPLNLSESWLPYLIGACIFSSSSSISFLKWYYISHCSFSTEKKIVQLFIFLLLWFSWIGLFQKEEKINKCTTVEDGVNGGDIYLIRCLDSGLEGGKRSGRMSYNFFKIAEVCYNLNNSIWWRFRNRKIWWVWSKAGDWEWEQWELNYLET